MRRITGSTKNRSPTALDTSVSNQAGAQANLQATRSLAERYKQLIDEQAVSKQEYDDANAKRLQAEATLKSAQIDLRYTKVLAPISGRIGRSSFTEGALVSNGQTDAMATIQQLDPIYVDVTQSTAELLKLRRDLESGQLKKAGDNAASVQLVLEDGSLFKQEGRLEFSEVSVDETTGSVTLRAEFPNPDHKLLPGMFVHALLNEGEQQAAILVPHQAVGRDARGVPTVWVVKPDNTVESREVQTLQTVGNAWLLGAGINDGERVITEGVQLARSGITVKPVAAKNVKLMSEFGSQVQAQAH